MKSVVHLALRRISSTPDNVSLKTASGEICNNPLYQPKDIQAPDTFVCGACDATLHFRIHHSETRCTICNQVCGTIQLTCDHCGFCICCNERDGDVAGEAWQTSCYSSYYSPAEAVRAQVYNRSNPIASELDAGDQQRWLQCMWHDIVQNMDRFRIELLHMAYLDTISATQVKLSVATIGLGMVKNLVRLFIVFQRNFKSDVVKYFSSLIQHELDPLGIVALETSVSLNGRLGQVKWLLHDLKVSTLNNQLSGAFGIAARIGNLRTLEYLMEGAGVDPSVGSNCAIRYSCENGHLDVVERLLQDNRVDPTSNDNYALEFASLNGHLNVVERLLQHDRVRLLANTTFALENASRNGHLKVVDRLLQPDCVSYAVSRKNSPLFWACSAGHLNIVERLLQDNRVDPSASDNRLIQYASRNGHLGVVERLLQDHRVNPSASSNYAIRYASMGGHLNVVERLLQDDRVDPSSHGNFAIHWASHNGHVKVVDRLLQDSRVDPSTHDNVAIRFASRCGHLNVVKRLLQDDRVDPTAKACEAIAEAPDEQVLRLLYNRARSTVCYMVTTNQLVRKLTPLHNESLITGGLCMNSIGNYNPIFTLPPDVIVTILVEWAVLAGIDNDVSSDAGEY